MTAETRTEGAARPTWWPWLMWLPAALMFFYAFLQRVAPSVMIDQLMADLAVGAAVAGNLSAFYFYAYATLQIPVGLMVDRFGPRRVLSVAAVLCTGGSALFSLSDSLSLIYLGRLLVGAGAAFGFVGALKLATVWFPLERFGRLSGLTMMFGMAGGIIGQAPLATVVEAQGWRQSMVAITVAGGVLAVILWTVVRDGPDRAEARHGGGQTLPIRTAIARVLTRGQNWLLALVGAAMTAPLLAFAGFWGVAWLMQVHGFSRPEAAFTASLLLIGWAIGSPGSGWLADRLGRSKPLIVGGCLVALACLSTLLYVEGLPPLAMSVLFFCAGFAQGAMVNCFGIARHTNDVAVAGVALAFVNMAVVSTGGIFQPLIGWLLDRNWDGTLVDGIRLYDAGAFRVAFSAMIAFLAVGLVGGFFLRDRSAASQS